MKQFIILLLALCLASPIIPCSARAAPGLARPLMTSDPIPLDEYWRRLDAAADLLEHAGGDVAAIESVAGDLAAIQAVQLPNGRVLPVDNSDLVAILSQADVAQARACLAALKQARDDLAGRPPSAMDQTFARLEEVLSRSEFAPAEEKPVSRSIFQRVLDVLQGELAHWLNRLGGQPLVEDLFTMLGIAVVLAVLVYAFRGGWRQWVAEGRGRGEGVAADADEADLSSSGALERAQALAVAGDYRRAVRYLYLSTLLWLDQRRMLRYDPALTNREYLRQVTAHTALHEELAPVVDLFDRVWYGFVPLDGRGYARYARQVERVRQVK